MEGVTSRLHDGDGWLDPLGQRRRVDNGRDFGGGVGCEVQLVVDEWGGGGKAREAGVGASAEGDDLFLNGG